MSIQRRRTTDRRHTKPTPLSSHQPGSLRNRVVGILCLGLLLAQVSTAEGLNRVVGWPGTTLDGARCYGEGTGTRFDYLTERKQLRLVERFHFTSDTEQLLDHNARLEGDLDYTLRSIPNHHRALWAMSRYYLRLMDQIGPERLADRERAQAGPPPPECYFHRGKAFNAADPMVPAIFGIYLHRRGALDAALREYKLAERAIPNNAELAYNMGLLYVDMGDLAIAQDYAERAKTLGYALKGLQRRIDSRLSDSKAPE